MFYKLLVLDTDKEWLEFIVNTFAQDDVEIVVENGAKSALLRILHEKPNVAIVDYDLLDGDGFCFLRDAKGIDSRLTIIITTACSDLHAAIECMKCGAFDYLEKTKEKTRLHDMVSKALHCNLLNLSVRYTHKELPAFTLPIDEDIMIGSTPAMMEIWKTVGKISFSDPTVLIRGESGTGKELLARAIYANSRRKGRPFLAINCAAIQETLLESELFGHEKGAFTGADCRRIGKFEQCHTGTILLDEIGEMSLANQGKVLRVLENQSFERVGSNVPIKTDVRLIACTSNDLEAAVKQKRFRLDLYHRLKVITFELPPLRCRVEDIPLLANLFISMVCTKYGIREKVITPEVEKLLQSQPWEGNVRELKNLINSAVVLSKGDVLQPEDFPFSQHANPDNKSSNDDFNAALADFLQLQLDRFCSDNNGETLAKMAQCAEKALIEQLIRKYNGNLPLVSNMMGISQKALSLRMTWGSR